MDTTKHKIRSAYLATRILDTPLWAIYNMVPLILYKDLHASPLEIALLVSLKPLMSVASFYFSHLMQGSKLTHTIIFARIIGLVLFLLFPFITSIPLILAAYGLYMAMAVGTLPSWVELLKQNLGESAQKKTFALGSSFGYLGGAILTCAFAFFLDNYQGSWKWLFQGSAVVALIATVLLLRLKKDDLRPAANAKRENLIIEPWRQSVALLKTHPDFGIFQAAFMAFGFGLMVLQPALPVYFVDELHMSYVELAVALSFCKGISYAAAAPYFASSLHNLGIFRFGALVASLALFFPLFLMLSKWHWGCIYLAYILYGIMQAGSELAWNMSGPIFSKEKESVSFTRLNIISVGLRGALAPAIGACLISVIGSFWIQGVGMIFFLMAALIFAIQGQKTSAESFEV